jgi:hypothetical protein
MVIFEINSSVLSPENGDGGRGWNLNTTVLRDDQHFFNFWKETGFLGHVILISE